MRERVDLIVLQYGEIKDNVCHIKIQQAVDELPLMPIATESDRDEFMKAFLLMMFRLLLCPTTNGQSLATSLLPAVSIGAAARDYDWCTCAHNWLMTYVRDFRKRLHNKGGGCVLFLQTFSLDHLVVAPLSWGVMPRSVLWTEKKLAAAIQADLLPSLDYGKQKGHVVASSSRRSIRKALGYDSKKKGAIKGRN